MQGPGGHAGCPKHTETGLVRAKYGKSPGCPKLSGNLGLFNCNDELLFRRKLEGERQVDVRIRSNNEPGDGIHYKIIDGGPKAYVSRHALGSKEGSYKIVEYTRVPPRYRGYVTHSLLGMHKEEFEHAFEVSIAVN